MVKIYNKKNNALYYMVGSLATLTLLASGVFAAVPYAQFLAPMEALGLGTPLIAVCAAFSLVVIALSYKAVSKNNAISKKDAKISSLESQLKGYTEKAVYKEVATEFGKAFTSTKEAFSNGRVRNIVERDILSPSVEVATELGKAFTSTKEAFSNGRVRNIVERDILSPSVEMATELGKAFTSTKEAFSNGRVRNIVERDILSPLVEVATELEKAFTSIKGLLTEKVKVGGWFSARQVSGAKVGVGVGAAAVFAATALCDNGLFSHVSDLTPLANNPTGVDDLHNGNASNSLSANHNSTFFQSTKSDELNMINNTFEASQERAKQNFGIKNPKEYDFCEKSAPIQANGTVAENTSVPSVYSVVKDRVFGLFTGEGTTSNGTAEVPALTSVNKNYTVSQKYVYGEQDCYERSSCHSGDYQAPLPSLQGMTICCPINTESRSFV